MATLQQAMTIARIITNDTDATAYARTDATLLQLANDSLDAVAAARPDLFYVIAEMTCIAGQTFQSLNITGSLGLVDVINVKNGAAVREADKSVMDSFRPGWHTDVAGPATEWMRAGNDTLEFYVYPKAPTGQILNVQQVAKPAEYTSSATHTLSDSFTPIIADYIVAQLDSMEDDSAQAGRSAQFMSSFYSRLGAK